LSLRRYNRPRQILDFKQIWNVPSLAGSTCRLKNLLNKHSGVNVTILSTKTGKNGQFRVKNTCTLCQKLITGLFFNKISNFASKYWSKVPKIRNIESNSVHFQFGRFNFILLTHTSFNFDETYRTFMYAILNATFQTRNFSFQGML
jgi:hypothetical protein